jgi:DNA ligase (NAD+)
LAGSKPGPEKIKKAGELGIQIIDEGKFRAMLPEGQAEPENIKENKSNYGEPTLF